MVAGILLMIAYSIYALGKTAPAPDNMKSWAVVMLVFIGVSVAVMIVIQILFHIGLAIGIAVKEKEHDDEKVERIIKASMVEDERDKLISLKASHIGYACGGTGFIAALIVLAVGLSTLCALHIVFGSFFVGSIVEGCVSIYHHERGIRNG
jgi:hypothetical protein